MFKDNDMFNDNIIAKNVMWRFLERSGSQVLSLVVSIVLARILGPAEYGMIALVLIINNILSVFVDSGLGKGLIQKKNVDELDYNTVFFTNVFLCLIFYLCLYCLAPYLESFYGMEGLCVVTRVSGITIVVSGLKNIQVAYVSNNLMFKKFFFSTLTGKFFSSLLGLTLAYEGFGIWALVMLEVSMQVIDTIVLWINVSWRPRFVFSFDRLKKLYSYSFSIFLVSFINNTYNNIRQLLIGKVYSSIDLALFNKGKQFPSAISTNINSSIDTVMFPVLSYVQNDLCEIKSLSLKAIKYNIFFLAPLLIWLFSCAENFVYTILTEKWMQSSAYIQVFCIVFLLEPFILVNFNIIKSIGKSRLLFRLSFVQRCVDFFLIVVSINYSPLAMSYSMLIGIIFSILTSSYSVKRIVNISLLDIIKETKNIFLSSIIMGVSVNSIQLLYGYGFIQLGLQCLIGAVLYLFFCHLFKVEIIRAIRLHI